LEENKLISLLQQQDEAAFKFLVEKYQRKVYNVVLSLVQNAEEAEDLAQEVFVEVYQSVGSFRGDASLNTWLYRIATTKALGSIRKAKAKKRFSFLGRLFGEVDVPDVADFEHPGVVLEQKEMAGVLFKRINELPENQRAAYTLAQVEGLSYQEVAAVMEMSVSAIESLLFRAKQNLKNSLRSYYTSF
jgi:RNA polymerase sigma factor (sigma-70 family)